MLKLFDWSDVMTSCFPQKINQTEYLRKNEKRILRKISNGLGFFIFFYYISMILLQSVFIILTNISMDGASELTPLFLIETIGAVGSSLLVGLLYLLISNRKLSDTVATKPVKVNLMIPVIFVGMAVSMTANSASQILAENFTIFGVENKVDMSITVTTGVEAVLYIIATAVVPAFAEEFAFRGIILGSLRKYGDVFSIIASAVMFGLMHRNTTQIVFAFILGLIFGFITCKTNSIIPAVIIHFLNNLYAVILDMLNTTGVITDRRYTSIYFLLVALFCILGLLSFLYLIKNNKSFFNISDKGNLNYIFAEYLSLKDKFVSFFINPGMLIIGIWFITETILNMGAI